jgi:1-acyl-sn-glycerol-3-phosphate acyltransferase
MDETSSKNAAPRKKPVVRDRIHPIIYPLTQAVVSAFFRLGGLKVRGLENLPEQGRFILAPNHVSHFDPPLVSHICPRTPHIIAKAELFKNPIFGGYIARLGAFPVQRGKADRQAIRRAMEVLENETPLIVFPEGTRSPDGNLQSAEIGFAMIAHATKSPIVPVYLKGTQNALSAVRPGFRFTKTEIHFGEPLFFEEEYSRRGDRATLEAIGARVMQEIAALRDVACENTES